MQTLCPESGLWTAPTWPKIRKKTVTSQFPDMMSLSIFFDVVLFLLSCLVTGPSFMLISSLVLELWQFSFIRNWPEIRKSEIPPSEFCPISGDWGKLWILNLARISLKDCYWMLQNSRVTAYTDFELLRENQLGRLVTHEATHIYTKFIINNHALLHLWWRENLLKHPKVSKYYDKDCILNLFVLFMSLLTAPFIKSTHILVGVYFIFVKKRPIPNSKVFQ